MKNEIKITTGVSLSKLLDGVINESLKQSLHAKALEEKDKQSGDSDDEPRDFDAMKEPSKTVADESGDGEIKLDDVIERLNTIRSGKSFKDTLVQQRFEEYFNSLKDAERTAMFAFLKGIAQIVTGEVEANQALDPHKADVTMHKGPDIQKKSVKPNVIKKPNPPDASGTPQKSAGASEEDTTPPSPIQAKKRG